MKCRVGLFSVEAARQRLLVSVISRVGSDKSRQKRTHFSVGKMRFVHRDHINVRMSLS